MARVAPADRVAAMRSIIENQIRLTLSDPPGRAQGDEDRRKVYVASVLVFLELLEAARDVDYLARPLPLFYALSQAGRAIVAAHGDQAQVRGHGIAEHAVAEPVTLTTISSQAKGLFGAVADAIGAPRPTSTIELGAAWAALPDLVDTPHGDTPWPPALFIAPDEPEHMILARLPMNGIVVVPSVDGDEDDIVAFLAGHLYRYPDAQHAQLVRFQGIPALKSTGRGPGVPILFQSDPPDGEGQRRHLDFTACVPEHRYVGEHWLIPAVGGVLLPPLLLWWVVLFGLSILARYEPAVWRAALDVETPLAVPLEDVLDEALEAVPHWILWALTGQEPRTPRPG